MAKFAIGEIAIVAIEPADWAKHYGWRLGTEVEILSLPFIDSKDRVTYRIKPSPDIPNDRAWVCNEHALRKRPNPPNWELLSMPNDLPLEELI